MEHVQRVSRTLVYKGSILDVYSDDMLLPNGKHEKWDYIQHRKGAAAVLPVLPDGRILLVKQYRNALERYTYEIPAGCRDSKEEDMLVCAQRELEEETGYTCEQLKPLVSLQTTVAFCNEHVEVFLAEDLQPGQQHLDDAEEIELCIFTKEELKEMIYGGIIQDGKTVSAIMAYLAR